MKTQQHPNHLHLINTPVLQGLIQSAVLAIQHILNKESDTTLSTQTSAQLSGFQSRLVTQSQWSISASNILLTLFPSLTRSYSRCPLAMYSSTKLIWNCQNASIPSLLYTLLSALLCACLLLTCACYNALFPLNKYTKSEIMYNQFTKWQECYNTAQQAIINKA